MSSPENLPNVNRREALKLGLAAGLSASGVTLTGSQISLPSATVSRTLATGANNASTSKLMSTLSNLASGLEHVVAGSFTKDCDSLLIDNAVLGSFADSIVWGEVWDILKEDDPFQEGGRYHSDSLRFQSDFEKERLATLETIRRRAKPFLDFVETHHENNPHRDRMYDQENQLTVSEWGYYNHRLTEFTMRWIAGDSSLSELVKTYKQMNDEMLNLVRLVPESDLQHYLYHGELPDGSSLNLRELKGSKKELAQTKLNQVSSSLLTQFGDDWMALSADSQVYHLERQREKVEYLGREASLADIHEN